MTVDIIMKAPDFTLFDQDKKEHTLSQYRGNFVLLYFYPKDDTPGCTIEACSFRDNLSDLKELEVQVLGVSGDSVESHEDFVKKFDLTFPLLSDVDHTVGEAYGVYGEKTIFGKNHMGYRRESFLIDPTGEILKHYIEVKPEDHVAEIIDDMAKYGLKE